MRFPKIKSRSLAWSFTTAMAFFLIFALGAVAHAQEASSSRGFQPGNSYSTSEFETINTTNGNLILNFNLGSLAPGRGGLSGSMGVRYNGKLYDSDIAALTDHSNQLTPQSYIVQSDVGGCQRTPTLDYQVRIINRSEVENGPYQCAGGNYLYRYRHWRKLAMPGVLHADFDFMLNKAGTLERRRNGFQRRRK